MKPTPFVRCAWIALLLLAAVDCQSAPPASTYLYVVTCDARVDKLNTANARKESSHDLATSALSSILPAGNQSIDGCLANHPIFDAEGALLYIVAPTQAQPNPDGTRGYQVLAVSVPGMKVTKTIPAGSNLAEPPYVQLAADRSPRVVPAAEWRAATDIDLAAYSPKHEALPNQIIETSGDRVLLRILGESAAELRLAVANTKTKTLTTLGSLPATVAPFAHLAPGGDLVVLEVTEAGTSKQKTGELALFDPNTGASVGQTADAQVRTQYFLAISPDGKAVYHAGDSYSFVDLKRTFGNQPVAHPLDPARPVTFLAKF